MGHERIAELERIAANSGLMAPIPYENPERKEEVFYNFIESYAALSGFSVSVQEFTYREQLKQSAITVKDRWKERRFNAQFFLNCLDVLLAPFKGIDVFVLGSGMGDVDIDEEEMSINVRIPKYEGVFGLFGSTKVHEYKHIYHYLLARTLRGRGLTIDGYYNIFSEPNSRVPSHSNLKRFEKRILRRIIQKEKKGGGL